MTVECFSASAADAQPVLGEALRYLGYRGRSPDDVTSELIDECARELASVLRPACCFAYCDNVKIDGDIIDIGFGDIKSRSLSSHLKGCTGAYLFAATIGIGADRLIAKYGRIKPAKSVVIDALGSSAIESFCDNAELRIIAGKDKTCSRFSPGYGDLPLSVQLDFMRCLDMNRRLGITLSDSLLMTPTKSVTAIIGVGASNRTCGGKCFSCPNKTCIYRTEE